MVPRKIPRLLWLALPLAYFLYAYGLGDVGLFGPDEPRYASISREMARSGDWVTPRLAVEPWFDTLQPWFEKPVLLYWMQAAAFRLGLGPDTAPRLPVILLSVAFLGFYWWILNREFGCRAAALATLILGSTVAWIGFSQVGVTDLPLTVTFSAAMLLALPWIGKGDARFLPVASALLGLAVLAKYLLPLVLAAPLALRARGVRDIVRPRVIAPFLAVAVPWYALVYLRNGQPFLQVFWDQQFGRMISGALQHAQPWYFYPPRLLALLLPWVPLLPLLAGRGMYRDRRRLFLLAWILFGLIFFSLSVNKLPSYMLPLLPAMAALLGVALDELADGRVWLVCCALLLVIFPIGVPVFPAAVANQWAQAAPIAFHWTWLLPAGIAAAVWMLEARGRRLAAVFSIAAGAAAGLVYLKSGSAESLNRMASARTLWQEIEGRSAQVCVTQIHRNSRYGLNYYSVTPLPDCAREDRPLAVIQEPGGPPQVISRRKTIMNERK
jgi:4-amino-4-deoxy-L-arabinose transferase-like glycosyltransferase